MFLAHFFPLSERSGIFPFLFKTNAFNVIVSVDSHLILLLLIMSSAVNIKGVFNTSNETSYEKDPPAGNEINFELSIFPL